MRVWCNCEACWAARWFCLATLILLLAACVWARMQRAHEQQIVNRVHMTETKAE